MQTETAGVAILRENRFCNKDCNKRQRHSITIKGSILYKGYNICKYLCTQHRSTNIYKANINRPKGRNRQQYNNRREL